MRLLVALCMIASVIVIDVRGKRFYKGSIGKIPCSTEKLLKVRSKLECAVLCHQRPLCKTFQFDASKNTCYHAGADNNMCATDDIYYGMDQEMVQCPVGYTEDIGLCFNINTMTQSDAAATCEGDGGHLLTISSSEDMNHFMNNYAWNNHVWIDGKGRKQYDGKALEWEKWLSGRAPSTSQCAILCENSNAFEAWSCSAYLPFVCQFNI